MQTFQIPNFSPEFSHQKSVFLSSVIETLHCVINLPCGVCVCSWQRHSYLIRDTLDAIATVKLQNQVTDGGFLDHICHLFWLL